MSQAEEPAKSEGCVSSCFRLEKVERVLSDVFLALAHLEPISLDRRCSPNSKVTIKVSYQNDQGNYATLTPPPNPGDFCSFSRADVNAACPSFPLEMIFSIKRAKTFEKLFAAFHVRISPGSSPKRPFLSELNLSSHIHYRNVWARLLGPIPLGRRTVMRACFPNILQKWFALSSPGCPDDQQS